MGYFADLKAAKDNEMTLRTFPSALSGEERSYADIIDRTFYRVDSASKDDFHITAIGKPHEETMTQENGAVVTNLVLDSGDIVAMAYVEDTVFSEKTGRGTIVFPRIDFTSFTTYDDYMNSLGGYSTYKEFDSNGRISVIGFNDFMYYYDYNENGILKTATVYEDIYKSSSDSLTNVTRTEYRDDGQIDNIAKIEYEIPNTEGEIKITRSDSSYTYGPDGNLLSKEEASLITQEEDIDEAASADLDASFLPGLVIYEEKETTQYHPNGSIKSHEETRSASGTAGNLALMDRETVERDEKGRIVFEETVNHSDPTPYKTNQVCVNRDRKEYTYDADGNAASAKITSSKTVIDADSYRWDRYSVPENDYQAETEKARLKYMKGGEDLPRGSARISHTSTYSIYENGVLKEDGREEGDADKLTIKKEDFRYYPDGQLMTSRYYETTTGAIEERIDSAEYAENGTQSKERVEIIDHYAKSHRVSDRVFDQNGNIVSYKSVDSSSRKFFGNDFGVYTETKEENCIYTRDEDGRKKELSETEKHINSATNMQMETTYTNGDKSSMTLKVFGIDGTEKSRLEEVYGRGGSVNRSVYENGVLTSEAQGESWELPDLTFTAEWAVDADGNVLDGDLSGHDNIIKNAVTYNTKGQPLNAESVLYSPDRGITQSRHYSISRNGSCYMCSERNAEGIEKRYYEYNERGKLIDFKTHKDDGLICETKHVRAFITEEPVIMEDISHGQALSALGKDSPLYNELMDKNYSAAVIFNPRENSITVYTDYDKAKDGPDKAPAAYMERKWGKDTRGDGWEARSPERRMIDIRDLVSTVDSMELYAEPAMDISRAEEVMGIHDMTNNAVISAVKDRGLEIDTYLLSRAIDQRARD